MKWWRVKHWAGEQEPFSAEEMSVRLATSDYETIRWDADKTVLTQLIQAKTPAEAAQKAADDYNPEPSPPPTFTRYNQLLLNAEEAS